MAIKQITVLPGQSIWDIAVQEYGSPSGVAALITDNLELLDLSATPVPGTKIKIDSTKIINNDVVAILTAKGIKPANAIEILNDTTNAAFTSGFSSGFN